jgi:hypothetical protein
MLHFIDVQALVSELVAKDLALTAAQKDLAARQEGFQREMAKKEAEMEVRLACCGVCFIVSG